MTDRQRSLQPRHEPHDRPWLVSGPVHVRHHRVGAHVVWYAEDDDGVLALSESREELTRALQEQDVEHCVGCPGPWGPHRNQRSGGAPPGSPAGR